MTRPPRRRWGVVVLLLLATSPVGAQRPDSPSTPAPNEPVESAFLKVAGPRLHAVNARDIVDANGNRTPGYREGHWTLDFGRGQGPAVRHQPGDTVLIFVHGYNTSLPEALSNGTALRDHLVLIDRRLRELPSDGVETSALTIYLFLWRGDLGPSNFATAQRAADVSATSLTHFIAHVSQGLQGGKIVLMAHSLGVRVALEALRRVPVDSAVFVQGAVPVTSIYRWTATNVLSESSPVESCTGRYADVIRNAGHLLYTFTRDDSVLATWFSSKEWYLPHDEVCFLPIFDSQYSVVKSQAVRSRAIGSPFDTEGVLEAIGKPRPLEDRLSQSGAREPGVLPKGPFLQDLAALYKFRFHLEHPNVERVDLSTLRSSGVRVADWHTPIFEKTGASVVELLWRRVLAALK